MFCPQCGTETREALKFCKQCGVNLRRVQGVMSKGGGGFNARLERVDWQREALEEQREKRKRSPEEKRLNEIKGGVITTCLGLGLMVFFSMLFEAIADNAGGAQANILRSLWAVGLVPFLIGLGVLLNGLFVSKKIVELKQQQKQDRDQPIFPAAPDTSPVPRLSDPSSIVHSEGQGSISGYSVTESTTTKLREPR